MIDEDSSEPIEQLTETLYNLQLVQRTAAKEAKQIEDLIQKLAAAEDDSVLTEPTSTAFKAKDGELRDTKRRDTQRQKSASRHLYTRPIRNHKQDRLNVENKRNHTVSPDRAPEEGQSIYLSRFPACTLKVGDIVQIVNPSSGQDRRGVVVGLDGSRFVLVKTPSKPEPIRRFPKNLELLYHV